MPREPKKKIPELFRKLSWLNTNSGKTSSFSELSRSIGVARVQITRWYKPSADMREENKDFVPVSKIPHIASSYGIEEEHLYLDNFDQFVQQVSSENKNQVFSYAELLEVAKKIDDGLLECLRNSETTNEAYYQRWLNTIDAKYGGEKVNCKELNDFFARIDFSHQQLKDLLHYTQSHLVVKLEDGGKLTKFSVGESTLEFKNNDLMWPCTCQTEPLLVDLGHKTRYQQVECPIHNVNNKSIYPIIDFIFAKLPCQIRLDNLKIIWQQLNHIWPPSIDVAFFLEAICEDLKSKNEPIKSILDIGAGTGVLSQAIAKKFLDVKDIHYSDWVFHSSLFSFINHKVNFPGSAAPSPHFYMRNKLNGFDEKSSKFDLAICNPPYVQHTTQNSFARSQHTVSGTEVLEDFILRSKTIARKSYVLFSSVSGELPFELGKDLKEIKSRTVPFRVPNYLRAKEFVQSSIEAGNLVVKTDSVFPIQHKISLYEIR